MLFGEVCGLTVGRRFGREVRLAGSVFNSFFDFNGDALELAPYFNTSVFLVQVADISNLNGFSSKIVREGELIRSAVNLFCDALTRVLASSIKLQIWLFLTN